MRFPNDAAPGSGTIIVTKHGNAGVEVKLKGFVESDGFAHGELVCSYNYGL